MLPSASLRPPPELRLFGQFPLHPEHRGPALLRDGGRHQTAPLGILRVPNRNAANASSTNTPMMNAIVPTVSSTSHSSLLMATRS
jgi:hypothetical protein